MARWKYKTSILDLDRLIPPEAIACDDSGTCHLDGMPGGAAQFQGILDHEGESEWELVQVQPHGEKVVLFWKQEIKEAYAS